MWMIDNSAEVVGRIKMYNRSTNVIASDCQLQTYDVKTLYTLLPHNCQPRYCQNIPIQETKYEMGKDKVDHNHHSP